MAYATRTEVANRLGITLSSAQQTMVDSLLDAVSENIALAVGKPVDEVDPVPAVFKHIAIDVVVRAFSNPTGAQSRSESLGQFSHSETFQRELSSATQLTDDEQLRVRRAYWGTTTGSAQVSPAIIDDQREALASEQILPPIG